MGSGKSAKAAVRGIPPPTRDGNRGKEKVDRCATFRHPLSINLRAERFERARSQRGREDLISSTLRGAGNGAAASEDSSAVALAAMVRVEKAKAEQNLV